MKNILQPVMLQLYRGNLAYVRSRSIFRQQFVYFGSSSPPKPPDFLEFDDRHESQVDNAASESELPYNSKDFQKIIHKKQPMQGDVPMRRILASTNKMLFGPLLETSQEKKRRLKREARGIDESEPTRKSKKKRKNKAKSVVQPLILNPGNSHHLQIFTSNPKDTSKENSEPGEKPFNLEEGNTGDIFTKNTKRIILKQNSVVNSYQEQVNIHRKKIILVSRDATKTSPKTADLHNSVDDEGLSPGVVSNVMKEELDGKSEQEICAPSSQDIKEFQYVTSKNNNGVASFLSIDNSKFTAAPPSLDITEMERFPLFSDISPVNSVDCKERVQGSDDIISIGLFDGGYQKLPSVRKILEETMPLSNKIALEKWKAKMIKELGEEGFSQYRQGLLDRGKLLHGCIQSELSGVSLDDDHTFSIKEFWRSMRPVLPKVSDVHVLESRLIHPYLYYQGAVDCVASYRGIPMLIEWKTSSKPKLSVKSMFDDPLQVVAYLGALNFDANYKLPRPIESAMLAVAYENGLPAHVHILKKDDCEHYWRIWCSRLCQFWKQQKPVTPEVG